MEKVIIDENKRNKLNREITGVIQKDRIWEQWYCQEIFNTSFPKMSQKDYLLSEIGDDDKRVIIDNRGMKDITVGEFKRLVIAYEKAFSTMNFNKGDVICTIGLTTPEMILIKYSATSLGLIVCNLNVFDMGIEDDEKNRLYRQMENIDPKMIFTLDIFESKIFPVINDAKFSHAIKVTMPLEYSTPRINPERLVIGLKVLKERLAGKKITNTISLNEFLSLGKNIQFDEVSEIYEEGLPCNISFTSGTTGINKGVLLSHDANNALAYQHKIGNFGFKKGESNLALVPPFLAFWDADIIHTVMSLGGKEILELTLAYDKIPNYFKKYRPNIGVWSQHLWSSLLTLPCDELKEISKNIQHAIVGGERCEVKSALEFYDKTGIYQWTGFGATEVNTAFSMTHPYCFKVGTAGIPLPFNNVKIVDDKFNDVTYNVPGRLFITGPCLMNGYYNNPELTEKVIYRDEEGNAWYETKDYAVMDDDGCLTVIDRYISPIEVKPNVYVNMLDIVEVIKEHENIKHIKMTNVHNKLILHLSLYDIDNLVEEEVLSSIISMIRDKLSYECYPDYICVYDELPRTAVGKVDYPKLTRIGESICFDNDNLDKFQIIKNYDKVLKKVKSK